MHVQQRCVHAMHRKQWAHRASACAHGRCWDPSFRYPCVCEGGGLVVCSEGTRECAGSGSVMMCILIITYVDFPAYHPAYLAGGYGSVVPGRSGSRWCTRIGVSVQGSGRTHVHCGGPDALQDSPVHCCEGVLAVRVVLLVGHIGRAWAGGACSESEETSSAHTHTHYTRMTLTNKAKVGIQRGRQLSESAGFSVQRSLIPAA